MGKQRGRFLGSKNTFFSIELLDEERTLIRHNDGEATWKVPGVEEYIFSL